MLLRDSKTAEIGFAEAALIFLYVILGNLAVQFVASIFILFSGDAAIYVNYVFMAILQICFVAIVFGYLIKKKSAIAVYPLGKVVRTPKENLCDIFRGAVVALVALFTFYQIADLFDELLTLIGFDTSITAFEAPDVASKILIVVVTCIFAPIGEELVFRGVLLHGLRNCFGKWSSVVLCGLAFSLFHMNPSQTVYQFFLGCAFALIAYETRSLVPSIVAHALNNLFAVLILLIPSLNEFVVRFMSVFLKGWAILAVLPITAAGVALVWLVSRSRAKGESEFRSDEATMAVAEDATEKRKKRFAVMIFLLSLGICVFIWLINFIMGILM